MDAFPSQFIGKEIDTRPTIMPGDSEIQPNFFGQGRPLNDSSDANLDNIPSYDNPVAGERFSAIDKVSNQESERR